MKNESNSILRPLLTRPRNPISACALRMAANCPRRGAKSCLTRSRKDPGHPDRVALETVSWNV
jgi:hypothetical protein